MMNDIRLVSWDVDGTLYSHLSLAFVLLQNAFRATLSTGPISMGKTFVQVLEFHRKVEKQRKNPDCEVLLPELEELKQAENFERRALEIALRNIRPRECAVDLLKRFADKGTIQVAFSDFECEYKLEALGLSHYFQKSYSCRQIGFWKPSPVGLSCIQREFGVDSQQHLHVGDRPATDGKACMRNGCRFLHMTGK